MELGGIVTEEIKNKKYSRSIEVILNVLPLHISASVEEKKKEVIAAADKMPSDYKEIVVKRFVEGKDFEIIERELYGKKPDIKKFHFFCQYKNALSMVRAIIDSKINKKSGTELVADLKVNPNFPRKDILYLIDSFKIKYTNLREYVEKTGIRHNYILKLISDEGMQFIKSEGSNYILLITSEKSLSEKIERQNKHLNDFIDKFPDMQDKSSLEKEFRIRELIEKLQSPYKEVGEMYHIENKNFKYIANEFGMSQDNIRKQITKFDSMMEILTDPEIKNKIKNNFLNYLNRKIKTHPRSGIILHIAGLLGQDYKSLKNFIKENGHNSVIHYLIYNKIIETEKLGKFRYVKNPEKASGEIDNFYKNNWNPIKFSRNMGISPSTIDYNIKQRKINAITIGKIRYININNVIDEEFFDKHKERIKERVERLKKIELNYLKNILTELIRKKPLELVQEYVFSGGVYLTDHVFGLFKEKINFTLKSIKIENESDRTKVHDYVKDKLLFRTIKQIDLNSPDWYEQISEKLCYRTISISLDKRFQ